MAQPQMIQVKLSRFDAQPWGFRLQGGVDFAAPLLVQKVNAGSLAEKAGLLPGDSVIKINDVDVYNLRHKEAQDVVVRSGNNFLITVQRGGSTWRPQVTPTGQLPQPNQHSSYLQTVTKTSLAHKQQDVNHIGCGYNNAARPFANGGDGSIKSIVNKQYNTPVGIYSDESIAETLSAQAEVLAGGVLGVNFKKNEKEYQAEKSEVLKFLREEETGESTPALKNHQHYHQEPQQQQQYQPSPQQQYQSATRHVSAPVNNPKPSTGGLPTGQNICTECDRLITPANFYWSRSHAIGGNEATHRRTPQPRANQTPDERISTRLQTNATQRPSSQADATSKAAPKAAAAAVATSAEAADPRVIIRPVCPALQGPEYKAEMEAAAAALACDDGPKPLSATGHPQCQMCGVGIVGVFVRIKDKNLHVECFKCATCGTSLKNQGYYNFNNKLYCDIHAKLAALQSPPSGTEGYVPVPIKPNTKLSANTISSALNAYGYSNGVANGGSAPATSEEIIDLPLPPPPSPTQLQQFQYDNQPYYNNNNSNNLQQPNHTRTHSSLSTQSNSSSTCSSMSPISPQTIANNSSNIGTDVAEIAFSHPNNNNLVKTASPSHSRKTSSSFSPSLSAPVGNLSALVPTPPPPPPLMPAGAETTFPFTTNNSSMHQNSTKMMQQHVASIAARLQHKQQQQNENDMNIQNKNAVIMEAGTGLAVAAATTTATTNLYNKFLKEYSNKFGIPQTNTISNTNNNTNNIKINNSNNNNNNTLTSPTLNSTCNNKTSHINRKIANGTAKPFSSCQTPPATNVAAASATLANQLKFNPCQVVNPTATIDTAAKPSTAAPPTAEGVAAALNALIDTQVDSKTISSNHKSNKMLADQQSSSSAANAAQSPGDQPFEYVTLTGNVIRSVVPPGKGVSTNYKVNQGYARPFGSPVAPSKSPVAYPPQQQQPKPAVNPYATLPRSNVAGQQGRNVQHVYTNYNTNCNKNYSTLYRKPSAIVGPNKYSTVPSFKSPSAKGNFHNNQDPGVILQTQYEDEAYEESRHAAVSCFADDPEIVEANRQSRAKFAWPPPKDDCHSMPTAAPLYIAPPETQHIVTKPLLNAQPPTNACLSRDTTIYEQQIISTNDQQQQKQQQLCEEQCQSQQEYLQWQSRSAPQLTVGDSLRVSELSSSSDSYTSTSTTTTTTSEEYQRMYSAQVQAYQMQQGYEQSGSELDYHMDMEVAAMQPQQQCYLRSAEFSSGRRSAQECAESLTAPLSTYRLIDMVREVTPTPDPPHVPRHVVFSDEPDVKLLASTSATGEPLCDSELSSELLSEVNKTYQGEMRESQLSLEDTLVVEDRSHIMESQRIFQPTPEIKIEIPAARPIPPTNIRNPVPREWINPMVRALTTAPETPFHIVECLCAKPCDCSCKEDCTNSELERITLDGTSASTNNPLHIEKLPSPEPAVLRESPPRGSFLTKAMSTAPEFTVLFAPAASQEVPLPEETVPYMPPPIDMKPYLREDFRPKTPLLSALTTAPDKPFEAHFERDVPIHELDLPTPKAHLTMSEALQTAPERAYTPLNPEYANQVFNEQFNEKGKKNYGFQNYDQEQDLAVVEPTVEKVEFYTTQCGNNSARKSSAFAAMQAFKPSYEPLSAHTPCPAVGSQSQHEPDLDFEKYCKAKERNQKRLDYFQKMEAEKYEQQQSENTQTHACQKSSLSSCTKQSSLSSQSSSTVQRMSNTSTYNSATNASQATTSSCTVASLTASKLDAHDIIEETAEELEQSEVLFPPPSPLSHLKAKAPSGLRRADTIPKYQRNWTVLPTQSPVRTPEPQELRGNVPLAFLDVPHSPGATANSSNDHLNSPVAQMSTVSTGNNSSAATAASRSSITSTSTVSKFEQGVSGEQKQRQSLVQSHLQLPKTTVPIIVEDRSGPVTMAFQPLHEHMQSDQSQTPTRAYTPSLINKPAPVIPFYQTPEKLCFEESPAAFARNFERCSVSPLHERARSPAPGPPPNPLSSIRAPRLKDNESSPLSQRVLQAGSITTGQSYLGAQQQAHQQQLQKEQDQLLSHCEVSTETGRQTYTNQPETLEHQRIGDITVEKRAKESQLEEQKKSQLQTQTKMQVGNATIERHRRVTEEFEHTQTAKTVEIRTGAQSSSERRQSYGKTGYVANQARRLSGLEQEITNLTSQSQAISARASNLSSTVFPHLKSPEPTSRFPTSPVMPAHDDPKEASYIFPPRSSDKKVGPPPGFQKMQGKEVSSAYGASLLSLQSQQQQQKSLSAFSSINTSSSSQANSVSCCLTKASATNIQSQAASTTCHAQAANGTGTASSICPITGTFCRPGHTCCKQQQLQTPETAAAVSNLSNNNNINAIRANASTGSTAFKPSAQATVASSQPSATANLPPVTTNVSDQTKCGGSSGAGGKSQGGAFGATSAPKRGRGVINKAVGPGVRVPLCNGCQMQIRTELKSECSELCLNTNNTATLPRKPFIAPLNANNMSADQKNHSSIGVSQKPQRQPHDTHCINQENATALLADSIGKIDMGDNTNNFMTEAGKIISNMLEARLANSSNGSALSKSGSSLSLRSNSSSNLSKSPMVMRKRFELDDFKDFDPTEPESLKPVVALPQSLSNPLHGLKPSSAGIKDLNHPMVKVLQLCDNRPQAVAPKSSGCMRPALTSPQQMKTPITPSSVMQTKAPYDGALEAITPLETVVFRNDGSNNRRAGRGGELSTHAIDRRSYIELAQAPSQADDAPKTEGEVFSIAVKPLGRGCGENTPMSPENEEVFTQLLKDGKRPICCQCQAEITKGPFITALGRIWCPDHFICVNGNCRRPLQDIGFVEEKGDLYCEYCFEKYLAPTCSNCAAKIKGDCLNAIGKHFHPECFTCAHCGKLFGNTPFFLEEGKAYCEADWNELFTTKCFACGFPVEAGDRWVEALNNNYHSQCFNCTFCKQNLEGQSFYNKGGRPFCKNHAR